jgi:hypothetical protein
MVCSQVTNIKKTLKNTPPQADIDEQMVTDSREISLQPEKPSKKSSKTKGLVSIVFRPLESLGQLSERLEESIPKISPCHLNVPVAKEHRHRTASFSSGLSTVLRQKRTDLAGD